MNGKAPTAAAAASAAKPKVVNPYAKKKSVAALPPAPAVAAAATTTSSIAKGNTAKAASSANFQAITNQSAQGQKPPQPPDVDPSCSFSQAFGDNDPDADFAAEERTEQRKFDETLLATNNIATNSTQHESEISDRDNHRTLSHHVLHVSKRQQGNPVLNHVRNVPFQQSKMVPDYIFSPTRCALFLSIRYHNLHSNYIRRRISELGKDFDLRVLLCYVDVDDNANVILSLNNLCVENDLTLILAWSEEEAARYLETLKAFDGKDATLIQKREHTNYPDQIAHALGSVRSVNKTDASQLLSQFGTWKNLVGASVEELSVCPGVGVKKVRRLYEAFHRPFTKEGAKRRKEKEAYKREDDKIVGDTMQHSALNTDSNNDTDELTTLPTSESITTFSTAETIFRNDT